MQQLDQEFHQCKWVITIQGLPGETREDEDDTRKACIALTKDHLGIEDATERDVAACHRLRQENDAGIIARFVDLQKCDQWLLGARCLKNSDLCVSLGPDLPPVLRPLKKELLEKRRVATRGQIQGPHTIPPPVAICRAVDGQEQSVDLPQHPTTCHRAEVPWYNTIVCFSKFWRN